jgi:hypothetical protein
MSTRLLRNFSKKLSDVFEENKDHYEFLTNGKGSGRTHQGNVVCTDPVSSHEWTEEVARGDPGCMNVVAECTYGTKMCLRFVELPDNKWLDL